MKTTAAILVETAKPLELTEIDIPQLKPGQTLVEILYSGVCHTQVLEARGYRGEDKYLPHCLGHEGSGIVREISPGVSKVKPGDAVILSWMKGAGCDVPGTVYPWGERKVNSGAITTFSKYSVISENRLTLKPADLSLTEAALVGCALPTGLGAVINTAKARPGNSLAVFGVGGVGLSAVAGAVIAGCVPVIAVDVLDEKLDMAVRLGATHTINASRTDPVAAIRALVPGGLDFAVEASGRPPVMLQAIDSVRNQGGTAVIIGNARFGELVSLDPGKLNQGKSILGTWGGDNMPDRDFPKYCRLIAAGRLNVNHIITKTYSLEQTNQALDDLEAGRRIWPLIRMSDRPARPLVVGVDFDNTIAEYDTLFHRLALEQGLIPADLPADKTAVRDYLRAAGREDDWTIMQGDVYGARLGEAPPFPGALDFFAACAAACVPLNVVSHKTRHPYRGRCHDLHRAARDWMRGHGFYDPNGIGRAVEHTFLELTKEEKLLRIGQIGCTHFIDDLPEFLAERGFPSGVDRLLFDPNDKYPNETRFPRFRSWDEISKYLL